MHRTSMLMACFFFLAAPPVSALRAQTDRDDTRTLDDPGRPVRTTEPVPGVDAASQRLIDLQKKIRDLKAEAFRNRKSMQARLGEISSEKKAVRRTIVSLGERVQKGREEIAGKRASLEKKETELEEKAAFSKTLREILEGYLDTVESLVQKGIPWKKSDRIKSLEQIRGVVTDENTNDSSALAAVGRLQEEEEALGRLVETSSLQLSLGGKEIAVQGFHLGLLAVIFANEDGSILGFAQAGQALEDGLTSVSRDEVAASGYLMAVDILRRKRTPGIVEIYLPSLPTAGEVK